MRDVVSLAQQLIQFDTRSTVSNVPIMEYLEHHVLEGFRCERIDYVDRNSIAKRSLVAIRKGLSARCLAFSGHVDTVPATGWTRNPFEAPVEGDWLYGLGSTDMKGPLAATIAAASNTPTDSSVAFLITADEEIGKEGSRRLANESQSLRELEVFGIVVAEPTGNTCIRGHRVDVQFRVDAAGRQAHSSTGKGENANIRLVPFLSELRDLHLRLRREPALQDHAYEPPFCDLNFVIDNYGTAPNVTVERATCLIKFRYSKGIDPNPIVSRIEQSAAAHGLAIDIRRESPPPEIPASHALVTLATDVVGKPSTVAAFGTDASELSRIAPCIVLGPGTIDDAHQPDERVSISALEDGVATFSRILRGFDALPSA